MDNEKTPNLSDTSIEKQGGISQKLSQEGIPNKSLESDHIGVEIISVEPNNLYEAISFLKN